MLFKSTVDWCEVNYTVVWWIAEFWNTISGVAIVLAGYLFKKCQLENCSIKHVSRINLNKVVSLLYTVGVGTMLFHGTLWYPFQLLDELPMIMISIQYISIFMSLSTFRLNKDVLPYEGVIKNIVLYSRIMMVIISFVYFVHPMLQIVCFHVTLKIFEAALVYIIYYMSINLNAIVYDELNAKHRVDQKKVKKIDFLKALQSDLKRYIIWKKTMKTHTRLGLIFYAVSICTWVVENMLCNNDAMGSYIKSFNLHAIWHVLSSIGIYHLSSLVLTHVKIDEMVQKNSE
jgi:hypothetical protein